MFITFITVIIIIIISDGDGLYHLMISLVMPLWNFKCVIYHIRNFIWCCVWMHRGLCLEQLALELLLLF